MANLNAHVVNRPRIVVDLLLIPGYYDTALRDLGLLLAALALVRLAAGASGYLPSGTWFLTSS